jgi:hypothetical protein
MARDVSHSLFKLTLLENAIKVGALNVCEREWKLRIVNMMRWERDNDGEHKKRTLKQRDFKLR